jgi:hypothetical protein
VPGTQEVSEAAGGHDVGRAKTQFVREIKYFIFSVQLLIKQTKNVPEDHASTARNGVGRETGSSPTA